MNDAIREQRHREGGENRFLCVFSAALCVLCGKKKLSRRGRRVRREGAEGAEKKFSLRYKGK